MRGITFLRIILAIVLIGMLIGAGAWIYKIGVANGIATGAEGSLAPGDGTVLPYRGPYLHPWGWGFGFGFFPFGLLFPLVWILIFFALLRGLFFRRWYGHGPHHWGGPHRGEGPGDPPPFVEEWHRKMHGESRETPQS